MSKKVQGYTSKQFDRDLSQFVVALVELPFHLLNIGIGLLTALMSAGMLVLLLPVLALLLGMLLLLLSPLLLLFI